MSCCTVVTQLGRGLDVVYFCPFAGTVLWTMYCRLFIWLNSERFMGLGLSVIDRLSRSLGFRLTHLETYKSIIYDSYPWAALSQT